MEWIRENWIFVVFLAFFIAIHFFGHGMPGGGCGGHERRQDKREHRGHSEAPPEKHQKGGHGCC